MMHKARPLFIVAFFSLLLAACGSNVKPENEAGGGVRIGSSERDGLASEEWGYDPLTRRTVYFEFNSAQLDDETRFIVEAHAYYLAANPGVPVTLEGHADERGTREYNLALGERRAEGVSRMMSSLGVDRSRVTTISYGEEKPAAVGQDESAWRLNRRVEIIYGN